MKAKNVDEFRELIKRYKEVLEMEPVKEFVPSEENRISGTMHELTGFGSTLTCTLCEPCRESGFLFCDNCLYRVVTGYGCSHRDNKKSYFDIVNAKTWEELKEVLAVRIEHMKGVLESYESEKR